MYSYFSCKGEGERKFTAKGREEKNDTRKGVTLIKGYRVKNLVNKNKICQTETKRKMLSK